MTLEEENAWLKENIQDMSSKAVWQEIERIIAINQQLRAEKEDMKQRNQWLRRRWDLMPDELRRNARYAVLERMDAAEARVKELEQIAGLLANPKIAAAVKKHIQEAYQGIKPDSSFSQVHKVYQTGDALWGPSVVVEWHNRKVWFSLEGDEVEINEYPAN